MIERHWGLTRRAFANTPDPAFVYDSSAFGEGMARLRYDATELRGGLSLVTGEIGCGKTVLAQSLAAQLAGSASDVILMSYARMTPVQLLARLAEGLGIEPASCAAIDWASTVLPQPISPVTSDSPPRSSVAS
jgi:general secretion pathway protein A